MVFEAEVLKVFALVMVRFTGLLIAAPILSSNTFPAIGKIAFAGLAAMVVTPTLPAQPGTLPDEMLAYGVLAIGELAIGLMMGFVMTLVFAAVQVAGQIMDMLSGFALVNVFNPALETQVPILGFFLFVIAALFLLVLDGHHLMIVGLVSTFERVPLGGLALDPQLLRDVSTLGRVMFYDALLVAAPIAGAMLLTYASLGLLGRVVPQIHLIVVGFPVTIAFGLLLMAFLIGFYLHMLEDMFYRMFRDVSRMINLMS